MASLYEAYGQLKSAKVHFEEAYKLGKNYLGVESTETQGVFREFDRVKALLESNGQLVAAEESWFDWGPGMFMTKHGDDEVCRLDGKSNFDVHYVLLYWVYAHFYFLTLL